MKVLVTGGTGKVGTEVASALLCRGASVGVLTRNDAALSALDTPRALLGDGLETLLAVVGQHGHRGANLRPVPGLHRATSTSAVKSWRRNRQRPLASSQVLYKA